MYPTLDSHFLTGYEPNIKLLLHLHYQTSDSYFIYTVPQHKSPTLFTVSNIRLHFITVPNNRLLLHTRLLLQYLLNFNCTHTRLLLHYCTQHQTPTSLLYPTPDSYFIIVPNTRLLLHYCTQHQTPTSLLYPTPDSYFIIVPNNRLLLQYLLNFNCTQH